MHALIPTIGLLIIVPMLILSLIDLRKDYLNRKNR